jgi:hypothetical protein|uniref:Uncharacterized protein n=1 Tax=Ackermannviridae sp. TaxID=2831612 RepID=A0A8S5VP79_9CAUD|nr:MAG TPA: hypothetical protein [Ackermannviridae sp.]
MLKQKKRRIGVGAPTRQEQKGKYYMNIVSLKRAAVKLAITADLVLLLAALGSLNIPTTLSALLALNLLCGLYPKEESSYEEI